MFTAAQFTLGKTWKQLKGPQTEEQTRKMWDICTTGYPLLVTKLCQTLLRPHGPYPPGSSVHGFPRQGYGSGLARPSPGDLPNPGTELTSPALADVFFTTESSRKPNGIQLSHKKEWNHAVCSYINGHKNYYTKWSQTMTSIIWYHLYVEPKKWYKWSHLQNRNTFTDIENKLMATIWKRERGKS